MRIAVLDDEFPLSVDSAEAFEDMEVVWTGSSLDALIAAVKVTQPDVIVLNVDLAGRDDPPAAVSRVRSETGVGLIVAIYSFLRRRELQDILLHARALQGPVSLDRLRGQLHSLRREPQPASKDGPARKRRFTKLQLTRLLDIQSVVDCECPNHVSELVSKLLAFESYAVTCENKNPADARIHAMLGRKTGAAREIMEDALEQLIAHEKIQV